MAAYDIEWDFGLPTLLDNDGNPILNNNGDIQPDVNIARELYIAGYDFLNNEYIKKGKYPQALPLEMRIIKGNKSNSLCTGYGLDFVCTIEVLTLPGTDAADKMWNEYIIQLGDVWIDKYIELGGDIANARPHWGKIWPNTVKGKSIYQHFKICYGDVNDEAKPVGAFNKIRKQND
eukprot:277723_1